jgi:hypothetical protein
VLPNLKHLTIWLDHDGTYARAIVNERVLFSFLRPLFSIPNVKISLYLPKLHPRVEREKRHFMPGMRTPFHLHRRLRQRYHGRKDGEGRAEVFYTPEYPCLADVPRFRECTIAELKAEERRWWEEDRNVEEEVKGLIPFLYVRL